MSLTGIQATADAPPSRTDQRALGAAAGLAADPVAQLVPTFLPDGAVRLHGLVAERHPWPVAAVSPVDVMSVDVGVIDDTPNCLEAEAITLTKKNLP